MKIVHLNDLIDTPREVSGTTWTSRRLLLKGDGMGFSLHDTLIHAGTETEMRYLNHLEAVYCIEGEGEVEDLSTGIVHPIKAGTVYALDNHQHHKLRAASQMRMVCVFNPPLTGLETHGPDLAYPLLDEPENDIKTKEKQPC